MATRQELKANQEYQVFYLGAENVIHGKRTFEMATQDAETKEAFACFRTSQGIEIRASLVRLSRFDATLEVYSPDTVIKTSESLEDFRIFIDGCAVYSGRALVHDTVNTGTVLICSVMLDHVCFDADFFAELAVKGRLRARFDDFLRQWQKVCRVEPRFKIAVADIQTFLVDLRQWIEQVEIGIRSSPKLDQAQREYEFIEEVGPQVIAVLDSLFEKFEMVAAELSEEQTPVHRSYIQRHLHPIVLAAPFAYRCHQKPLGFAGDYEMIDMILRDPREGSSLFAKMFNVWLLQQTTAAAHRNRIGHLKEHLLQMTATAVRQGRPARVLNLGCGPVREIRQFLADTPFSNETHFTLVDFDEETLRFTSETLKKEREQHRRATSFEFIKKSVQQLLKDGARGGRISGDRQYDLAYCAGLFDYLSDRICKRLMSLFYECLTPGGLVVATNVSPLCPNRGSLELILDWHLIYRDATQVRKLVPEEITPESVRIQSDFTGLNLFLEARKPNGI